MKPCFSRLTLLTGALLMVVLSGRSASVRDFGAQGDGRTDDTAAVQRAVDEARDGVIEFPKGDYRLTRTIEVKLAVRGRTSLTGQGGVGRVTMAGPGPAFRFTGTHAGSADPKSFQPSVWEAERMPQVDGLEILGAHPAADGLEFSGVMQPTVRATLIRQVRHGIRLVQRNRNVLIDSCHLYQMHGAGVFFDQVNLHQAIIHGSHISYCRGGGIKIAASEIRNLQITGNDIEYNHDTNAVASADIWIDVTAGSVREGTIAGNTIQALPSPGGANIRFVGSTNTADKVGLFSITGNIISSQQVNVHLVRARGVTLSGNTVFSGHERNFIFEDCRHLVVGPTSLDHNPDYTGHILGGITVQRCQGVAFTGLVLEGAEGGMEQDGGAIEILNSSGVTLTGCQLFEPGRRGIYISGSRNVVIGQCTILDRRPEPMLLQSIRVTHRSRAVSIQGNVLAKGPQGDVEAEAFSTTEAGTVPAVK